MFAPGDHVVDHVDAYLYDALSPAEAGYVQEHCEACRVCQVALEEAQKRLDAMQSLPVVEASEELIQATGRRIQQHRPPLVTPVRVFGALAAAAALVIGCFHVYYLRLSPSPYDLRVLGQAELIPGSDASIRVLLIDRQSAEPIENVPVEIELADTRTGRLVQLASFTTNRWGSANPRLRLPDWADGQYELRVRAKPGGEPELITRTVKLQRSWRLMLSSDKPVYQPGQVIQLRSLALARPDLKPVAGRDVVFSITDPKGNRIFRQPDVTSRFGIASAECPLATEILEGPYQIECQVGDTASRISVEVKKYVLPKFKIGIELDEPYYRPGQRARGTVQADYFSGKPVAGADVEIEVRTSDVQPGQPYRTLTTQTDPTGAAQFEFHVPDRLIGREQDSGDARIALLVTVRDTAGQTQSKTISRVVTTQPIRVEVIPESGTLVRDVPNTVYLFTGYADGRPAQTRIAVTGIDQELTTSELGVASVELTPRADRIGWTIRATDGNGNVGRREIVMGCGRRADDFLVRTDRAVYDGDQTMHLVALGGGVDPVFIDLVKDGQTMLTDVIQMSGGRGDYQFDLPPELFGTVELCAYRYGIEGLPVRKTRVIYIRQAGELNIQTTLDHDEYRPGAQAKLTFTLTDDQGNPTPGALSLAAVDEAVFSVLDQAPGMEQAFFTLEQELLEPIYAIYPWSPDFTPAVASEEKDRLQRALFARTAQEAPTREDVPGALHTLSLTSYPAKLQQVRSRKDSGLQRLHIAWSVFAVVGGIAFTVLLWCSVPVLRGVIACLVVLGLLIAVLLPAVNSARFSSRIAMLADTPASMAAVRSRASESGPADKLKALEGAAPPRLREWFPETLLWRPELITDDDGRATIELPLADSITTWRLSASAVSAQGKLGAEQSAIRVFQPFFVDLNLPVALALGDEVTVPVVVYNYLDKPQTVELTLAEAPWFEPLGQLQQGIELGAGEVRSVGFTLRARKIGPHHLRVDAQGSVAGAPASDRVADAIKREIDVVPDGPPVEQVSSGTLQAPVEIDCTVPPEAIEGSVKAIVKLYPSSFSQLVEGLDAIFQRPYGCFEQTSSTTYPNVLALDYLRRTDKSVPEVEAKARQYIHLGYQRLVSFEVAGGGFDWFGRPPANRTLTAYGLMEFTDMAQVHDVDPSLIRRTRQWLLDQQRADGSWANEPGMINDGLAGAVQRGRDPALATTAYIAWAVFAGQSGDPRSRTTLNYLLAHEPASIDNPYVLALVANALVAIDPSGRAARPYLDGLERTKQVSADGKLVWWEQSGTGRTMFYGAGQSGSIETTALASLAMIHAGHNPGTSRSVLAWLVRQKDGAGTWHSTQATVLALKALLAGTSKPLGEEADRRIEIALDGQVIRSVLIPADQSDVVRQIDLSSLITEGSHRLALTERSESATGYQVSLVHYLPRSDRQPEQEPLSIELTYDRTELAVDDTVTATATVVNNMSQPAPMVILDLPIPAGFAIQPEDLADLAASGRIARYQLTARSAVVYLRQLSPEEPLTLRYQLRATMPVKVTAQPAQAYEYYNPDTKATSTAMKLAVLARD